MKTSLGMAKIEMGVLLMGVTLTASVLYVSLDNGLDLMPGFGGAAKASVDSRADRARSLAAPERAGIEDFAGQADLDDFFADERIESLNDALPDPANGRIARIEADRLAVQLRRFEDRYGSESVAARSVRLRLAELDDYVGGDVEYAAAPEEVGACGSGARRTSAC